jgi:hypothetical protein
MRILLRASVKVASHSNALLVVRIFTMLLVSIDSKMSGISNNWPVNDCLLLILIRPVFGQQAASYPTDSNH